MNPLSELQQDRRYEVNSFDFSGVSPRILLGSDSPHLVSAVTNALLKAGFQVDTARNYLHVEELWNEARHEVILFEVSKPDSIEPVIQSALRIKRQDAQQFIAYLVDSNLRMSGLTGDAVFSRDIASLPENLREVLNEEFQL